MQRKSTTKKNPQRRRTGTTIVVNAYLYVATDEIEKLLEQRRRVRQLFEYVVVAGMFAGVLADRSSVQRVVQLAGYFGLEKFAQAGHLVALRQANNETATLYRTGTR